MKGFDAMKKRIFGALLLVTVIFGALLALTACGERIYEGESFTVSRDKDNSVFEYDYDTDMTYAMIPVRIKNESDFSIKGLSFIADFKDKSGKTVSSVTVILAPEDYSLDIAPGTSYSMTLEFYKGSEFGSVYGEAASVNFRPYSMTVADAPEVTTDEDGEKIFGTTEIITTVLCVSMLLLGAWLIFSYIKLDDGIFELSWFKKYPEDLVKPGIGILLCAISVIWAVVYFFFVWNTDTASTFGILEIVIAILCLGGIGLGSWLLFSYVKIDGGFMEWSWFKKYPEDLVKPGIGILLIVASVAWAIIYYGFLW